MKFVLTKSAAGRRAATGTVLALAAATLSLGVAGTANAVGIVDLEGTVTGVGGAPVQDVNVYAVNAATGSYEDSAITDASGQYQLDNLSTGDVKLQFQHDPALTMSSPLPYTPRWLGGTRNIVQSTSVPVTADPGSPAVAPGMSLSEKFGAITGTATADGRPASDLNLSFSIYALNADDDDQSWDIVTEGSTYRMLVQPGSIRPGLEAYDTTTDPANPVYFIRKWWQDTYSQSKATAVAVGSGQTVTGINFALTKTLAATASPQILGFPTVGRALTAAPGTWSQMATTQFSYTWLRGATVVGTGPTYVPTVADLGSHLSLRVTAAADKWDRYHNTGQAVISTPDVVKYGATERVGAKAKAGRKVAVGVKLVSAKQSPVKGKVVVLRNGHVIKTGLKLVKGKVAFVLKNQPKGRQTYTVRYQGNKVLSKVDKSFTVRVH